MSTVDQISEFGPLLRASSASGLTSLPYELLADIFVLGRDIIYLSGENPRDSVALMKYLAFIPAVCSTWRRISLSTSALWNIILCPSYSTHNIVTVIHYLEALMERSQERLLTWEVTVSPQSRFQQTERVVGTLYPHIQRCRSISIIIDHHAHLFLPFPGKLENLILLHVSTLTANIGEALIEPNSAPDLQEFRYISRQACFPNIARQRLQVVEIGGVNVEDSMAFLASCSSVRQAKLSFSSYGEKPIGPPVILERLTTLSIPSFLNLPFRAFLATPCLEDLTIKLTWEMGTGGASLGGHWDPPPSSLQHLKKLTLRNFDLRMRSSRGISVEGLYELFLGHPGIEVLTLEDCLYHVAIPRLLVTGMVGERVGHNHSSNPRFREVLLPNLQSIRFTGTRGSVGNEQLGLLIRQLMGMREGLRVRTTQSCFVTSQIGLQQLKTRIGERLQVV